MKSYKANRAREKMQDEAVRWHALLSGDSTSDADWLAFTGWLEADDGHRQAYDAIEDILIGLAELDHNIADPAPAAPANNVIDARHRWLGVRQWAAAAVAIAATVLIVIGVDNFQTPDIEVQEYATGTGEQRLVTLVDGSTVRLNTNSKVRVMFEDKVRRTELAYGQGLFSIAKDAERPFLVDLGDSHVQVVGTVFDILRHHNEVRVTVAEGVVEVVPVQTASRQKIVRLLPGSQLVHKEGTANINVTKVNPAVVMAWENGYLEYDDARLVDVVNDLNRYFSTPIRVVGLARDLRFSGVVRTTDEQDALLILSAGLPVHIENRTGEILVLPDAN